MIRNLILSFLVLALSGSVLWLTLSRLDPLGENKILAYVALFVSLILFVTFFSALCFFFARELMRHHKLGTRQFLVSLRRGMLVSFFVSGVVALQLLGFISVFQCAKPLNPQVMCPQVVIGYEGLLEVLLWGVFLFLIELMLTPPRKRRVKKEETLPNES